MDKALILTKIAKLLALAERGGTVEEAEAAMQKVHELLAKYNLEISDVIKDNKNSSQNCSEESINLGKRVPVYAQYVASAMALMFDCQAVDHNGIDGREMRFIGIGADPIVATQTYQFILEAMKRSANNKGIKRADRNSYYVGYATAIYHKAKSIHKEYKQQEPGLVLAKKATIENYIAVAYKRLRQKSCHARIGSNSAYNSGYNAGQNASFNRGVANRSGRLRISA